jgi:hypothetical protein
MNRPLPPDEGSVPAPVHPGIGRMPEPEPLRPCAACGEPTRRHWCSESCRRAEDGPAEDEWPDDEEEV